MFIKEYIKQNISILFEPMNFLEKTKDDVGIKKPFLFFLTFTLIISFSIYPFLLFYRGFFESTLYAFKVLTYSLLISFGTSGIVFFIAKIVGSNYPFYQTYKSIAYNSAIFLIMYIFLIIDDLIIFRALDIVLIALWSWSIIFYLISIKYYNDLDKKQFKKLILIMVLTFFFVSLPFTFRYIMH